MEIIKNRPMPPYTAGGRKIPNDPARLMEIGDSVSFTSRKRAQALRGRIIYQGKKAAIRHLKETAEWVVWRIE